MQRHLTHCRLGFLLALLISSAHGDVKLLFQNNCAACHQLENKKPPFVGPSLVEINHLYHNKLKEFVQWSKVPGKKRKDAIQMPSMAHLGDKALSDIHAYIKSVTKGKKWKAPKKGSVDQYKLTGKALKQPRMQRIFLPNASPASIAITVDGQHSLCWDTEGCRVRYIWHGGFIDGFPYWKGNGGSLASLIGKIYYTAPTPQLSAFLIDGSQQKPVFKGYTMKDKLPEFHYLIGDVNVFESFSKDGDKINIKVRILGASGTVEYPLASLDTAHFQSSAGEVKKGKLVLTPKQAEAFTLTFAPRN